MRERVVRVTAPSRLHFGLLSFGNPGQRQFGGVGVMIDRPGLELGIFPSNRFAVSGRHARRVAVFAHLWRQSTEMRDELPCKVVVKHAARAHTGLGLGTQLGLSVASGLNAFFGLPVPAAAELAVSVNRGRRSAVGTFGFAHGGLIAERGSGPDEEFSQLYRRVALPACWRVVLVFSHGAMGLAGDEERTAFARMPAVSQAVTERMERELYDHLVPAAEAGEFSQFSASVYRYGVLAGQCFAACQGGPFASPGLAEHVARMRSLGAVGVGQSSWGPTLFAWLPDQESAVDYRQELPRHIGDRPIRTLIARVANRGARIRVRAACA